MNGDIVSRYFSGNVQDLKKSKPSNQALEQARFFLSLFKAKKLLQQGWESIISSGYNNQ